MSTKAPFTSSPSDTAIHGANSFVARQWGRTLTKEARDRRWNSGSIPRNTPKRLRQSPTLRNGTAKIAERVRQRKSIDFFDQN